MLPRLAGLFFVGGPLIIHQLDTFQQLHINPTLAHSFLRAFI